jgi:hypothetical protein
MKSGQKIDFIKDNLHPLKSPNTDLIGAWLTCGGSLLKSDPYSWTVEQTEQGPKQTMTYHIDSSFPAKFESELIDFQEFRKRWMDREWCDKNAEHPISYMRLFRDNMVKLKAWIKEEKPAVLIRRGSRVAVIHPDLPEARKAKILAEL